MVPHLRASSATSSSRIKLITVTIAALSLRRLVINSTSQCQDDTLTTQSNPQAARTIINEPSVHPPFRTYSAKLKPHQPPELTNHITLVGAGMASLGLITPVNTTCSKSFNSLTAVEASTQARPTLLGAAPLHHAVPSQYRQPT